MSNNTHVCSKIACNKGPHLCTEMPSDTVSSHPRMIWYDISSKVYKLVWWCPHHVPLGEVNQMLMLVHRSSHWPSSFLLSVSGGTERSTQLFRYDVCLLHLSWWFPIMLVGLNLTSAWKTELYSPKGVSSARQLVELRWSYSLLPSFFLCYRAMTSKSLHLKISSVCVNAVAYFRLTYKISIEGLTKSDQIPH